MTKFCRNKKGIGYLILDYGELFCYTGFCYPVCGECNTCLDYSNYIILIPILNEVYCNKCAKEVLSRIKDYPEDRDIRIKMENFFKEFYGVEHEEQMTIFDFIKEEEKL